MNLHRCHFSFFIFLNFCSLAEAALSLRQIYESALQKSEEIETAQGKVNQSDEKLSQARGNLFPTISASASYLTQDNSPNATSSSVSNAFSRSEQTNAKITLNQPIFRGFGEFAGLRSAKANKNNYDHQLLASRLDLYREISSLYFSILEEEKDTEHLNTQLKLIHDRVLELKRREKIGRSRPSEVLTAQAQEASTRSQISSHELEISKLRESLSLLSRIEKSSPLSPPNPLPNDMKPLEYYLSKIDSRPDIQAKKHAVEASEELITVARAGHFPTLDLTGNYYLKRNGILEGTKWDATLSLTLPIFQGGVVQSRVREAAELYKIAEIESTKLNRATEASIRKEYSTYLSLQNQIELLRAATEISEKSYKLQEQEYRHGLITNIEVLQALNALVESKRSLDRTSLSLQNTYANLSAAIGEIE